MFAFHTCFPVYNVRINLNIMFEEVVEVALKRKTQFLKLSTQVCVSFIPYHKNELTQDGAAQIPNPHGARRHKQHHNT